METGVPGIIECSDGEAPREWSKECESDSGGVCDREHVSTRTKFRSRIENGGERGKGNSKKGSCNGINVWRTEGGRARKEKERL